MPQAHSRGPQEKTPQAGEVGRGMGGEARVRSRNSRMQGCHAAPRGLLQGRRPLVLGCELLPGTPRIRRHCRHKGSRIESSRPDPASQTEVCLQGCWEHPGGLSPGPRGPSAAARGCGPAGLLRHPSFHSHSLNTLDTLCLPLDVPSRDRSRPGALAAGFLDTGHVTSSLGKSDGPQGFLPSGHNIQTASREPHR